MVRETAQVLPTNKLVSDSKNIHIQTKKIETATNMYPGRLVKKGTNEDDVVVGTAGSLVYGWLGYEQTDKKYRPATRGTIYNANDQAAVINGPGIILVAYAEAGATIAKGTRLTTGAIGGLSGGTIGTSDMVAIAEESPAAVPGPVLVRSLI